MAVYYHDPDKSGLVLIRASDFYGAIIGGTATRIWWSNVHYDQDTANLVNPPSWLFEPSAPTGIISWDRQG